MAFRTFKVVNKDGVLKHEYISLNEEYYLIAMVPSVVFKRVTGPMAQSFMTPDRFKRALKDGHIVFTD